MQKTFWLSQRQIVLPLEETNLSWKQQLPFAGSILIFQAGLFHLQAMGNWIGAVLWIFKASCACLVPGVLLLAGTALPGRHPLE